ncbi:MAG: hypothetical protein ABIV94_01860 [Acidimicrobiales bacterium]
MIAPAVGELGDDRIAAHRGSPVGAMIASGFGLVWLEWGASGMTGSASAAVRVFGLLVGFGILLWSGGQWRAAHRDHGAERQGRRRKGSVSMFSSRAFWVVAALEVVAIRGGTWAVAAAGHPEYLIVWVATVVGAHFLAFGRLFWPGFYWSGAALLAAGLAGLAVGLVGAAASDIEVTTGLMAGASLLGAGAAGAVTTQKGLAARGA